MRHIEFHEKSFEEFSEWAINKAIYKRLVRMIEETQKDPFGGIGKPEPLKGSLSGKWSKRIDDEHRLIYEATQDSVKIYSCRDHY
jgi:toxin YoeB